MEGFQKLRWWYGTIGVKILFPHFSIFQNGLNDPQLFTVIKLGRKMYRKCKIRGSRNWPKMTRKVGKYFVDSYIIE